MNKHGYTLVELCVVLALVAILSAMVVSFSVLVSGYTRGAGARYDFSQDCAHAKSAITQWILQQDAVDTVFSADAAGALIVTGSGGTQRVHFAAGELRLGNGQAVALDGIEEVAFRASGGLVKCVLSGADGMESSFVLCIRCGAVDAGEEVAHD